jgi:hypothetical protein
LETVVGVHQLPRCCHSPKRPTLFTGIFITFSWFFYDFFGAFRLSSEVTTRERASLADLGRAGMNLMSVRGLVFFGILFIASFLLSPSCFLRPLTHGQQIWVVRRLTSRHWTGVTVLCTILLLALTTWLFLSKSGNADEQGRAGMRQNSANSNSHTLISPIAIRVRR